MGVNELDMLKGIFEEQRALTDDEMQAYKDMLCRKENDMVTTDKVTLTEKVGIDIVTTDARIEETRWNDMGVKTEKKDQATLIAELISRVTSLEGTVEFILEHLPITERTEVCDECIYVKGSQWCDKCNGIPKHWTKGE